MLGWIILAYILLWILWWMLIPSLKILTFIIRNNVSIEPHPNPDENTNLTLFIASDFNKVKIVTDVNSARISRYFKMKHHMYAYYDAIKRIICIAQERIEANPNLREIKIEYIYILHH